jgi:alkanesulfonate monooxygenase SsuD/methylene tetrahydromethanopterin reductase-like flavin-dependent oxidoreductase (luciferase family)
MKFGVFYEHQLPRPWEDGDELKLFQDALDQVELADRLGIDFAWEVEHHFLEEYSHSSAPEVFLAAASQRTRRIRLGHGIVLMPPGYNHPARVAERIATLDLVSNGRVEWGTGMSASRTELEGFGVKPDERQAMWREAVEQTANMLVMDPYPGWQGRHFSMPVRNLVPKPAQKPHPPLWMACSNRNTIHLAAQLGIGALTFAFIDAAEAKEWVNDYYETFKRECVPIGHAVNPNIAMVAGFSCHRDAEEARRRGIDGFRFFQFALGHYYAFGRHTPGRTSMEQVRRGARRARHRGPRRRHRMHRHAAAGPLSLEQVRRRGCRPDGGHPAERPRAAPAHLRIAGAVRRRGDAGIQGARGRARTEEAGGARSLRRRRVRTQAGDEAARRP